ncbi:MAG: hypothetical protein GY928_02125 [Colwellia sp.]|nr:hypothetical protein [Colwellia sp.]
MKKQPIPITGFYKAVDKETKEEWFIYSLNYSGFPNPSLTTVTVLRNDNSDYERKEINEIDIYHWH